MMAHAESTVTINCPAEQIFDFLADGTNNPEWRDGVISIRLASGGDGSGAVYEQIVEGPGGRRISGDYRITTFERPTMLGFEVIAGPARPVGRYQLTPDGSGRTTVRFSVDLKPHGAMRLMAPMVSRQMDKEVASLQGLKQALEGPQSG